MVMPGDNTGLRVGYLAGRFPGRIGHLYSPRPGRVPTGPYDFLPFALDNGAFRAYVSGAPWDEDGWLKTLAWARLSGQRPRWAIVPDVVGDKSATLLSWRRFYGKISAYGWPCAFAVQDGMCSGDIPSDADVVFVGGSTEWKWANYRRWCGEFPRVHVGRVNSYRRLWDCHEAGAESVDGTGWFRGDHGSGRPWRSLLAYLSEATNGGRKQHQMELIA
jgi:hypothetical protein